MVERGPAAVPAASLAIRGLPWRSQDLAWARARRATRPRQHEDSGLPDGGRHQPQAAGGRSPCASSALDRPLQPTRVPQIATGYRFWREGRARADRCVESMWRQLLQRPDLAALDRRVGAEGATDDFT